MPTGTYLVKEIAILNGYDYYLAIAHVRRKRMLIKNSFTNVH